MLGIECVLSNSDIDNHLLNAKTLRGLGSQIVPASQ
jgi:hypothetical protein